MSLTHHASIPAPSLPVNLRHLEAHSVTLAGELPAAALDVDTQDEVLRVTKPLAYELEIQKLDESLLVRGRLALTLDCLCVRCLKPFDHQVVIPDWTCLIPLNGEERAPIVNDCVDLTPHLRDDILLALPQHPVCKPECRGLDQAPIRKAKTSGSTGTKTSAWSELDKLKLKN